MRKAQQCDATTNHTYLPRRFVTWLNVIPLFDTVHHVSDAPYKCGDRLDGGWPLHVYLICAASNERYVYKSS